MPAYLVYEVYKAHKLNNSITLNIRKPIYNVVFHSNDGNNNTRNQSFVYGTANNLVLNNYTRTGYSYDGWTTNANGTGTSYSDGQSVNNLNSTDGGAYHLYAKWIPNTYTITYDYNGGVDAERLLAKYDMRDSGNDATTLVDLSGRGINGTHVNTRYVNDHVEYYGTNSAPSWTKLAYMHSDYMVLEATFSVSQNYTDRYVLSDWQSGGIGIRVDGSGHIAGIIQTPNGRKYPGSSITPVIGQKYHALLSFDGITARLYVNGVLTGSTDVTGTYIKAPGSSTIMALGANPAGNNSADKNNHFQGNIYSAAIYSYAINSKTVTYDSAYGTLPTPYRQGYTFDGWYLGDTLIDENTIVNLSSDVRLSAHWSPIQYRIRYRRNGPENVSSMDSTYVYYDEEINLSTNEYVYYDEASGTYHTFTGWNTASDGSGISYADGENVLNLTDEADGLVQLFAQWS